MTSLHRTRAGLAATLAVASFASAAQADPNPSQRVQASPRAAAVQEQYYTSHKPAVPAQGHDFGTIDARVTAPVAARADGSDEFAWGDAAIGAGGTLGLALVFAGATVAISRRTRGTTAGAATS